MKASASNSETYSLQLKAASTGTAGLTLGSTTVAFGSVNLNSPATQTVKLTSSGTGSVTISAATVKGTGFTISGLTAPVTLSAGQTATLDLVFDPTAAGTDSGSVTISSNSASGATSTIALSGTGTSTSAYQVELNWDAPTESGVTVSGYHVYRAPSGSTSYTLMNSSISQPTTYTDTTVKAASTYNYEVTSVDSSGVESSPSSVYTATIP
ncbi:MAG: choice-of-anchor D domain-containing protein [Acidobacteriaceae bacterium]